MKNVFGQFIASVRREALKKGDARLVTSMGRERAFLGYEWGGDTFVFERSALTEPEAHQPVLLVRKADLVKGKPGYVMTLSTGNHAVAAVPLMKGQFWDLGRVAAARRNKVMMERVICANLMDGRIELSQRDVPTSLLVEADEWLQGLGFPLDALVMVERNPATLDYYQQKGQEWRVKPLAWTRQEMERATQASRRRINSCLRYYHSVKGVHFLSYAAFHALLGVGFEECVRALREMVSVFEGQRQSYLRTLKFNGHHEVELFGLRRGEALAEWVPALETLMQDITLGRISRERAAEALEALDGRFKALLERPQLADEGSEDFIETLYRHLTGAVYEGESDSLSLAFDDRRTALPGATYYGGRLALHPGADERTRVLLSNLDQLVSQNETIEYANIYELRTHESVRLGEGVTREIEFKTSHRPLCTSMIEKRLNLRKPGYGSYMLARVHAFKALGADFGEYRLLVRMERDSEGEYFLRNRCPGDSLDYIPVRKYRRTGGQPGEDPDVVLAVGALLGNAAAQNLVVKKFVKETASCRFGEGKEIFEFAYDIETRREMPARVSVCSVRGVMGWPDNARSETNLARMFDFYLSHYARVLVRFWRKHRDAVDAAALVDRFFDGFELKTREMHWAYSVRRKQFDAFSPKVRRSFRFREKWGFALWALDCQEQRLDALRELFTAKAMACIGEAE